MPSRPRLSPNARRAAVLLLASALVAPARAQEDVPKLRQELVTARQEALQTQAQLEVAKQELAARMDQAPPATDDAARVSGFGQEEQKLILPVIGEELKKVYAARWNAVRELAKATQAEKDTALAQWKVAQTARLDFGNEVADAESRFGVDLAAGAAGPEGVRWFSLPVFVWGGVVFLIGVVFAVHEGRRSIRRMRRKRPEPAASPGAVGLILVGMLLPPTSGCVPAVAGPAGATKEARLAAQGAALRKELADTTARLKGLRDELDRANEKLAVDREKLVRAWEALLAGSANKTVAVEFRTQEQQAAEKLRESLVNARTAELAGRDGSKAAADLQAERAKLAGLVKTARDRQLTNGLILIGTCFGGALLGFAPLALVRGRIRKSHREEADTCPSCLAIGKLEVRKSDVQDDRYPEPSYVVCNECHYKFRTSYRKLPRLCFPTVGVRGSGKTHWLVTAYDLIRNNNVPVEAVFQRAPSLADEQFDVMMDVLLKLHQGPQATTVNEMPAPLNFYARDTDSWGHSAAMLNLFDFSGELQNKSIDTSVMRRRALLMDGFVLFLDPTQLYGKGNDESIETQIRQVNNFYQDMCDMRRLDVGSVIPVPIAVCVSKMDLLTTDNPLGGQARPFLRELRATHNQPVTLELLRYRSQICEAMLPVMFQGWDIRKTLKQFFAEQVLFFPLTPIGIEESELGEKDLTKRTIAPFGIVEPILWLSHMHGYCVLE